MVNADRQVSGILVQGILPAYEPGVFEVANKMKYGSLDNLKSGEFGIILGAELANYLGVFMGDKVTVITPQVNSTPAGILPRLKRFTVVGMFQVGMYEYDRNMAMIHLDDAGKLFRLEPAVSGLRLKLDDLFNAPIITQSMVDALGDGYCVSDWIKVYSNFF
jgi:lipoprotein-releasing system permease protein